MYRNINCIENWKLGCFHPRSCVYSALNAYDTGPEADIRNLSAFPTSCGQTMIGSGPQTEISIKKSN